MKIAALLAVAERETQDRYAALVSVAENSGEAYDEGTDHDRRMNRAQWICKRLGLLTGTPGQYRITEKGRAWLEEECARHDRLGN